MPRLDGIDVSHWQHDKGPINWYTVRHIPTLWAATKATQRANYKDPTYDSHRASMRNVGFKHRLFYHWLSPTKEASIDAQIVWYLRAIGILHEGEGVMLDAEQGGITVGDAVYFLESVEDHFKRPSSVYTGAYVAGGGMWQDRAMRNSQYGPRAMHLAAYTSEARMHTLPGVGRFPPDAWQYSSNGPVPGVTGRCDMNRIDNASAYDLVCYSKKAPPTVPEEPEKPEEPRVPPTVPPTTTGPTWSGKQSQQEEEMKLQLLQDGRGVWVTGDMVKCRAVSPGDITFFAQRGLVDMDGPNAHVEAVTDDVIDRMR